MKDELMKKKMIIADFDCGIEAESDRKRIERLEIEIKRKGDTIKEMKGVMEKNNKVMKDLLSTMNMLNDSLGVSVDAICLANKMAKKFITGDDK